MRPYGILLAALAVSLVPAAGAESWKLGADVGLNLNQTGYSDSWKGSEEGTLAWTATADFIAEKTFSPKFDWKNTLKMKYGQSHRQVLDEDTDNRRWISPTTAADRIFLESLARMTLHKSVDPYLAVTFDSRFYDNRDRENRRYVNPFLMSETIGIIRTFAKTEQTEFVSRLGYGVRQDYDAAGGTEFERPKTIYDSGLDWTTDFAHTFNSGNAKYVTKLRVFQAVTNSEADNLKGLENETYWKATDLAWEQTLSAAVTKLIQLTLFTELLYDKETDKRGRFWETIGLGVTYKLF